MLPEGTIEVPLSARPGAQEVKPIVIILASRRTRIVRMMLAVKIQPEGLPVGDPCGPGPGEPGAGLPGRDGDAEPEPGRDGVNWGAPEPGGNTGAPGAAEPRPAPGWPNCGVLVRKGTWPIWGAPEIIGRLPAGGWANSPDRGRLNPARTARRRFSSSSSPLCTSTEGSGTVGRSSSDVFVCPSKVEAGCSLRNVSSSLPGDRWRRNVSSFESGRASGSGCSASAPVFTSVWASGSPTVPISCEKALD